jgi:hypothetical protein
MASTEISLQYLTLVQLNDFSTTTLYETQSSDKF